MTKRIFAVAALLMTTACLPSFAASVAAPAVAAADRPSAVRLAFFDDWGGEHRRHRHHHDDDDDDDEGEHHGRHHGEHHAERGGQKGPANPNAANAPVPDNGVFKSRPKVDVQ